MKDAQQTIDAEADEDQKKIKDAELISAKKKMKETHVKMGTDLEKRERNARSGVPIRQKGFYHADGFMNLSDDYEKMMQTQFKDFEVCHSFEVLD